MALTKIDDRGLTTPIDLLDNEQIRFGTGSDLYIYHDGTYSYLKNTPAGGLYLASPITAITNLAVTENIARFNADGAVNLYYDGSLKLATSADGTSLTGNATVAGTVGPSANATYNLGYNSQRWNDIYMKNDMFINDDGRICWGDGNDLQIYHSNSGGANFIETGSQIIHIQSDSSIRLQKNTGSENMLIASADGAVNLYYDNSVKLETTSYGVFVSGTFRADVIDMQDNKKSNWGDGDDLQIWHDGSHTRLNNATGNFNVQTGAFVVTNVANTENIIVGNQDGGVRLYYDNVNTLETAASGNVNITGAADLRLTLGSQGTAGTNDANWIRADTTNLMYNSASGDHKWEVGGSEKLRIQSGGGISFNGDSAAANALDDYERGTWGSINSGASSCTFSHNWYVKVGRKVTCNIRCSGITTPTSDAFVLNLPFANGTVEASGAFACDTFNTSSDWVQMTTYVYDSKLYVLCSKDNSGWENLLGNQTANNSTLIMNITYLATA